MAKAGKNKGSPTTSGEPLPTRTLNDISPEKRPLRYSWQEETGLPASGPEATL